MPCPARPSGSVALRRGRSAPASGCRDGDREPKRRCMSAYEIAPSRKLRVPVSSSSGPARSNVLSTARARLPPRLTRLDAKREQRGRVDEVGQSGYHVERARDGRGQPADRVLLDDAGHEDAPGLSRHPTHGHAAGRRYVESHQSLVKQTHSHGRIAGVRPTARCRTRAGASPAYMHRSSAPSIRLTCPTYAMFFLRDFLHECCQYQ
jgi:hypothetical protein